LAQKEFYQKGGKDMLLRRNSQKIDLLKKVPLFSNLSQRHLGQISKHTDRVQVERERVLAQEGKKGWEFIFVVDGKARVEKNGKLIRQLSRGNFFGEISLIDEEPRTATVIAETDMTLLVVHKRSFGLLLDAIPGLQKKMLLSLCKYLRRAEKATN
jgi:CRP/FNR family cyclic AMP-dependent transcriptional regulator